MLDGGYLQISFVEVSIPHAYKAVREGGRATHTPHAYKAIHCHTASAQALQYMLYRSYGCHWSYRQYHYRSQISFVEARKGGREGGPLIPHEDNKKLYMDSA